MMERVQWTAGPNDAMKHIIQRSKMFAPETVSDKAIDISRPNQAGINRVSII
jgi:hypothetical protein